VARVRLIHWDGPEGRERKRQLAAQGHDVEFDDEDGPGLSRLLRTNPPDAFVIDLTRRPSAGREVGMGLRTRKETRMIPVVFVDGDPEKVATIKAMLPDATYTTWGRLKTSIPRAIAKAPASPIVPPSSIYSGKSAVAKLGIKSGMRVALLGGPPGFAKALAPLPRAVTFSAKAEAGADLYLCVVRTGRDLAAQLATLGRSVDRQVLWIIWPKKASRLKSDVNGNIVRETGLALGWVDFKVCAIDDTWSGLAFKRRRG
jgi:CheY-like chemotaxis protein